MPDHSERKLATVLFADLVDSTDAAGEQDPERPGPGWSVSTAR